MKTMDADALLGIDGTDSSDEAAGDGASGDGSAEVSDTMASREAPGGFDGVLRALARAPSVRPVDMDLVGRTVGRFVVERRLGQGGMGIVYEATDPVLARKVALKVLRAGHRGSDGTRARLHEEARRVAALHHPHIAAVYDVGEHEGIVFLAMERASGQSLRARLAKPPAIAFARAVAVLRAIASGLACAHEAGIIHRDLKPENVVTGDDGTVKIIDFGIATSGSAGAARASSPGVHESANGSGRDASAPDTLRSPSGVKRAGRPAGTRRYMAPELIDGGPPSPRGDVFAFGVLAREVLSGTAVGPRDRAARAALQKLVTACAAEDPAKRPRDGGALLAELEAIAAPSRSLARPAALTLGAAAIAAAVGVLAARSVPPHSAVAANGPAGEEERAAASREVASSRDAYAPETARSGQGRATSTERRAPREETERAALRDAPSFDRGAAEDGRTVLADHAGAAAEGGAVRLGDGAGAVPVTTSVDRRGRLFATVPLDAVTGRPAPAGTLMPLGTIDGAGTRAEVVPDGKGGAVIRVTVHVAPGSSSSSGGEGSHTFAPGTLPSATNTSSASPGDDPFHFDIDEDGSDGPSPAQPDFNEAAGGDDDTSSGDDKSKTKTNSVVHDSVVCTAASPSTIHGVNGRPGTMRLVGIDADGDEILIAIVSGDGTILELGEGAAPCDRAHFANDG